MGPLPLHPAIVHLPLGIAMIMPAVALGLAVAIWRGWLPARAFAVALGLQVALLAGGLFALRTGEADGERLERTVGEAAIEAHEEAAETFLGAAGIAAAVLAAGAAIGARPLGTALRMGGVGATAIVLALGLVAGKKGGEIVYGHGGAKAIAASAAPEAALPPGTEAGDRDED